MSIKLRPNSCCPVCMAALEIELGTSGSYFDPPEPPQICCTECDWSPDLSEIDWDDYDKPTLTAKEEAMSPEAQRIAIAESVGIHLHDGDHAPSNYTFVTDLPDYLNDLNAIQSAEDALSSSVFFDYIIELNKVVGCDYPETATAKQRAESYLRAIAKWEGGDKR